MGRLTVMKARSVSEPGLYGDGGTLFLRVAPGGSKSWIQRVTIDGKRRDIGLGGFPLVSLVEAREKAFGNRRLARSGGDPLGQKRRSRVVTFREAAEATYEATRARWRNERTGQIWKSVMMKHAYPAIGDKRVDAITSEDVLRILTPVWSSKPEIARRLRQHIRATLRWCQAHGFIGNNPAGEAIGGALPAMPGVRQHYRALPYSDVPAALETVEASGASMAARLCLRFLVLTAVRSGEARLAQWDEIDMEARIWTIRANRMKMKHPHAIPLSDAAVAVLERADPLRDETALIFPSPMKRGRPLSDMALTKLLRDTGLAERATVHGFRSSFRDWASERTNADYATMEMALAHAVGSSVERSYARSNLLDKRRRLMDQWSAFLTATTGKVVKLHG